MDEERGRKGKDKQWGGMGGQKEGTLMVFVKWV